jgi:tetratricopeptide (TPR) repeat protein
MALVSSSISSLLLQSSLSSSPSFCQVCDLRFSRRSFVSGVAAAAGTVAWPGSIAAVASSPVALAVRVMAANVGDRQAAILATRRGMQLFSKGDVRGSVVEFDKALELDPQQKPYLWQRGLSLYYLRRFEEGAKQFRDDVAVNPNDTEEVSMLY